MKPEEVAQVTDTDLPTVKKLLEEIKSK